jgi:tetratricopeptide (TPR) repeat protein
MFHTKLAAVLLLLSVVNISGCDMLDGEKGLTEYNKGVEFMGAKNNGGAEQQFKMAIAANPDLAEAHLNLGNLYMETGWWEGAQKETETSLAIFERTQKTLAEGSTLAQSESVAYNNLGAIASHNGKADEAKKHFEKAVELDPNNAQAHANLK